MHRCDADALIHLAIGPAVAVLFRPQHCEPDARDAEVSAALSAVTGRPDLRIERRSSGRPRLAPPGPELGVSLSRRGGHVLAGYAPVSRVGVDLEADTPLLDAGCLARDHFSPGEARIVRGFAGVEARDAFLRLWVAKEAALKITGRGVFDGMRQPDCTSVFHIIRSDGAIAHLARNGSLPSMRLCVRGCDVAGGTLYCALAVED